MIWPVEFVAFRQAIAWIAAFMPPDLTMSSMARGIIDHVVFCKAMCTATCRTVHSRHFGLLGRQHATEVEQGTLIGSMVTRGS